MLDAVIGAGYALGGQPDLGYLAACMALFVAYVRAEGKVAGAHQEYGGPMAKTPRVVVLLLAALYCGLTPEAWQAGLPLPSEFLPGSPLGVVAGALLVIVGGGAATAVLRLLRIARALRETT